LAYITEKAKGNSSGSKTTNQKGIWIYKKIKSVQKWLHMKVNIFKKIPLSHLKKFFKR
jgi:hypothetical protein